MSTTIAAPVTEPQKSFLRKLASERVITYLGATAVDRVAAINAAIADNLTKQQATTLISNFLQKPKDVAAINVPAPRAVKQVDPALTPGVYDVNGQVFVVKPNQKKTGLYAKRLVEIAGERLNANNDRVNIEFVYAPGVIFEIKPEQKMALEDAKVLTIRYGRCIVCGRRLKAGKSVEQGIGPVCIKSFA